LFLYFLRTQLGFSMKAVVSAHASTLGGVYINLTKDQGGVQEFSTFSTQDSLPELHVISQEVTIPFLFQAAPVSA
jgi:hypothetical protein